jgi:hypothetical protein
MRELFNMNLINIHDDIDEETKDEMNYDEETISQTMDILFDMTKDNIWFKQLYDLAAGLMFSTDREIGLVVLFSYDNFPFFHSCLASFYNNPLEFHEKNEFYLKLKQKLT